MILQDIKKKQLQARKDKDKELTSILSSLLAEVSIVGKNNGNRETTNKEAVTVIKKFIKNAEYSIESLKNSNYENTQDRIEELQNEISVYESFLPKQLSKVELEKIIGLFLGKETNPNMGSVMKYLKENYNGLYNGKVASNLVKEILNG